MVSLTCGAKYIEAKLNAGPQGQGSGENGEMLVKGT